MSRFRNNGFSFSLGQSLFVLFVLLALFVRHVSRYGNTSQPTHHPPVTILVGGDHTVLPPNPPLPWSSLCNSLSIAIQILNECSLELSLKSCPGGSTMTSRCCQHRPPTWKRSRRCYHQFFLPEQLFRGNFLPLRIQRHIPQSISTTLYP